MKDTVHADCEGIIKAKVRITKGQLKTQAGLYKGALKNTVRIMKEQ